jgi:predicted MFS family arabinose efflux permease
MGLLLFAIGSIVCAVSDNILALLLGRFIQGAGAIGAVVTAMISDIVREEQRPKAMALMGGSIAASFALAMVVGPTLGAYAGINSLFSCVDSTKDTLSALYMFQPKLLFSDCVDQDKIDWLFSKDP